VPHEPKGDGGTLERQLLKLLDEGGLDRGLAACVAGDREPSDDETRQIALAQEAQGDRFYSELLFTVTHQFFPYEQAKRIWYEILDHKEELTRKLGRSPGVAVASLDYLTNVREELAEPGIISKRKMGVIAEAAIKDGLTGLIDRKATESQLATELRGFERHGRETSVIMLDIDDFKQVNDSLGHAAGDEVLVRLARLLERMIRMADIAGRYGGEEFLLVLPETDSDEAREIAERLRARVVTEFRGDYQVTISLGVATCPDHGDQVGEVVGAADQALYEAKNSGKNRVVVAAS
jgi:diguanylate cyclase (GGDEF)-like protein